MEIRSIKVLWDEHDTEDALEMGLMSYQQSMLIEAKETHYMYI
jgi:hypothetical protein